ncbi:MAG: hypothetical protein H3C43_01240 [Leptonema sp. (in: Bacteria)]|nr:hypothetical protein [Leptonema sp. (in: bacteria)]
MAVTAKGVSLVEKNGDSILLPASLFSEVYIQIHRHRGPRKQHVVSNLVFVRGPGGIEILLGVLSSLDEAKESLQKIAALLAIESLPIYEFASNEHFQQESKVLPVTESATLQSIPELVRITERLKEAKVVQFSNDGRTIRVKNYNLILPFFTYLLLNIALVAAFLSFYLAEVSLTSLVVVGIIAIGVSGIAFYLSILDRYFDRAISIQPDGLLLRRFLRWLPTTDANYSNRDVDVSQDQLTIRCHFNRMTVQPRLISYAEAKRIARLSKTYRDFNERLNEPKLDRYDKGIEFTSLNYSEIIAVYSILIELVNRG